jgi:hypothetical protein
MILSTTNLQFHSRLATIKRPRVKSDITDNGEIVATSLLPSYEISALDDELLSEMDLKFASFWG